MSETAPTQKLIIKDGLDNQDYLCITLIMGLMGAFFWAIRGTGGFGGTDGGALAGLSWAMLWVGFSQFGGYAKQRPYGHGAMAAAIIFGITFGGMTGYGVYTAWVRGEFYLDYPQGMRPVGIWTGYLALFLCGIHWGGITGAFMAWCAPEKPIGVVGWVLRILSGIAGAWLTLIFVRANPQLFLPFYSEGLYQIEENKTCIRALGSIQNIAPHVGLYLGFLAFEIARRDWRAVKVMGIMALGFAIPFAIGGAWHNGHSTSLQIDWWKNWEMTIGLGGGLSFGLAFFLFNQPTNQEVRPTTRLERILGLGFLMCVTTWIVIRSAHEGFIKTHELTQLYDTRQGVALFCIGGALFMFVLWTVLSMREDKKLLQHPEYPVLPPKLAASIIAIIVLAGYITSIPKESHLANIVLLSLYTFYILTSLALFAVLKKRQNITL